MENYNTGVNSEWYQNSCKEVERINKARERTDFISFSKKVYPFRIDEIYINLKTEEKIFVEHLKDALPKIYVREQHGSYYKLGSPKGNLWSKPYDDIQEAIKEAQLLLKLNHVGVLYIFQKGIKKAVVKCEGGSVKTHIL